METTNTQLIPKIGSSFGGGIYAGIIAGENGQPDYHLVHAPYQNEIIDMKWQAACDEAKKPIHGFDDWSLPNRREARFLAINSPESFDKDDCYWTSTQSAANAVYAWVQYFDIGTQYYDHKSNECRARAVRRFSII